MTHLTHAVVGASSATGSYWLAARIIVLALLAAGVIYLIRRWRLRARKTRR